MTAPIVTDISNGYKLVWTEDLIEATVSHIHQHRDGRVTAEAFYTNMPRTDGEARKPFLPSRQVNLLSDRALLGIIKTLEERWPDKDCWPRIIEQTAHYTLLRLRAGTPSVEVLADPELEPEPLEYLLWPMILKQKPVMLYGEGGTGKTQVAALLLICLSLRWDENPFNFVTTSQMSRVLVLDWENEESDWKRLVSGLCRGLSLPSVPFRHKRCVSSLSDDLEGIQREVRENAIDVLIIDSVGEACGGDLKEEENATKFFRGLRSMPTTTPVLIHHQSKTQEEKRKTPFGSAYFWNQSRSVWEIRHTQEPGDRELQVGIFHRKANFSEHFKPIGLKFTYDNGISVSNANLSTTEMAHQLSASTRILDLLKHGKVKSALISESLNLAPNTVSMALARLKEKNLIIKLGDDWALPL